MGLLKGTWSFTRYRVIGDLPEQFNDFIDEGLKKNAFSNFMGQNAEKCLGWTSLENVLDTDFSYAQYKCGAYLIFSLRVDRRTVPPSLLKLKIMEAEKGHLPESGNKKLYRHEREAIKERVQLELRAKALNIPAFYEVCWIPEKSCLLFGSLSANAIEDFEKHFKESFHLGLQPFLPWEAAATDGKKENNAATPLAPPADTGTAGNPLFWGREFLTWLWYKSEERNGMINIPAGGDQEIIYLQRLALASGEGEYSETVVCQGLHSDMKEGREALRQGKKIKEARLRLSRDNARWEFTFKADYFQFQSLKLPITENSDEEDAGEGQNMERIYLVESAMEAMVQLFAYFFLLRLSPQWENEELPRMNKWLQT